MTLTDSRTDPRAGRPAGPVTTSWRQDRRHARIDEVVRIAAVSATWLGLLLVASWWVRGGGVQDRRGPVAGDSARPERAGGVG